MEYIKIEKVTIDELDQLQDISKATFYETFASGNAEENMNKYLNEGFSVNRLTNEINDKNTDFYFASIDGKVIGYLKLNFGQSQTELQNDNSIEIERIYVLKEYHGKNVGQSLYNKALSVAQYKQADYVWLGVWEQNPRAISFYRKNGFVEFDKHIFKLGDEEQTDIMMRLKLTTSY